MSNLDHSTHWITLQTQKVPIYVGNQLHKALPQFCVKAGLKNKFVIVTHPELKAYAEDLLNALTEAGFRPYIFTIPTGESSKSLETLSHILDYLLSLKLERQDTLIALGGGIVGDLTGFAASIYMRGINLIQIPTSLLAQVDAAIGGKTGINHTQGKNLIGSFYHPQFVLIDPTYLKTLPKREILCGLAEIVKYGVIQDKALFLYIEENQEQIKDIAPETHPEIWRHLIERSVANKALVVSQDAKESHLRKILNFGHTIGHAIETVYSYAYLHGEAVSIGMYAASSMAFELGLLPLDDFNRITTLLKNLGFHLFISTASVDLLEEAMTLDKKIKNGNVQFILPTSVGNVIIQEEISMDMVKKTLRKLMI